MKIGFTGDFFVNGRVSTLLGTNDWENYFSSVNDFFSKNDFNIFDLESPITYSDKAIDKTGPNLKMAPDCLKLLKFLNCTHVATANNHFYDYGLEGIEDTYRFLKDQGIEWTGSGRCPTDARQGIVLSVGGLNLGVINICENEWTTIPENTAGCNGLDLIDNYQSIIELKSKTDFFIVIFHGGHEHYNLPSIRIKKLLRHFVDLGASAVIGHHTHVYSGYEIYKGSPIFYSLGNFLFDRDSERDSLWNFGMLLNLKFDKGAGVSFSYTFIEQNNHKIGVSVLDQNSQNEHSAKFLSLSKIIQNESLLQVNFNEFVEKQVQLFNFWLNPYPGKLNFLFRRRLLPSFISKNRKRLLNNLVRCESHRDVLQSVLKKI